jgi:hypothetical protein
MVPSGTEAILGLQRLGILSGLRVISVGSFYHLDPVLRKVDTGGIIWSAARIAALDVSLPSRKKKSAWFRVG